MGAQHGGPVIKGPAFQPPAADDPTVLSGHRISARLGDGALGRVLFAHAPDGRPAAVTVIRPELAAQPGFAARFHHEGQLAQRVSGPYTVPITGSGTEGGRYWFASAYVPALSLRAAVGGAGPLPVGGVLRLVAGIAEALAAVHHAGAVHGDLRPSHVLLTADGPLVKDYGIARAADATLLAGAGGTPFFSSPEQAAGGPGGPATDVFALGQIAAYAATGAAPFGDGPAHTVLPRVAQEEADLSELPGELREIVTRCLIKDPALRPSPAQIIAMCGQAAPESVRPRTDPWLPPALLAALVPPMPPPAPPVPVVPPPPVQPPAHGWAQNHWPGGWALPVHMHLPRPLPLYRPRRRWTAPVGALAGLAVAITAGVALVGGFDGSSARRSPASGGAAATNTTETAQDTGPAPAPTEPTVPPGVPTPTVPGNGGGATGVPQPPPGRIYQSVELPAGYGLSLAADPLQVGKGPAGGTLRHLAGPEVFSTDPHLATLALLEPGAPGTLAGCRAATHPMPTIPRAMVNVGSRLCVQSLDGTVALATFRQLTARGEPSPRATLDITVWRNVQITQRSAPDLP